MNIASKRVHLDRMEEAPVAQPVPDDGPLPAPVELPYDIIAALGNYVGIKVLLMMSLVSRAIDVVAWRSKRVASLLIGRDGFSPHHPLQYLAALRLFISRCHLFPSVKVLTAAAVFSETSPFAEADQFTIQLRSDVFKPIRATSIEKAIPSLTELYIRGGSSYDISLPMHTKLTRLEIEHRGTGVSMARECVAEISEMLPSLQTAYLPIRYNYIHELHNHQNLTHLYISPLLNSNEPSLLGIYSHGVPGALDVAFVVDYVISLTPPNVGVNLNVYHRGFESHIPVVGLILDADHTPVDAYGKWLEGLLEHSQLDSSIVYVPDKKTGHRRTLTHTFARVGKSVGHCVELFKKFALPFINDAASYKSLFTNVLIDFTRFGFEWDVELQQQRGFAVIEWVFEHLWPQAIKKHSREELIEYQTKSGKPASCLFALGDHINSLIIDFAISRPDIFGDLVTLRNEFGESLLFNVTDPFSQKRLIAHGLSPLVRNHTGMTALENASVYFSSDEIIQLLHSTTPADLAKGLTPIACADVPPHVLLRDFIKHAPRDRWPSLITASIHGSLINMATSSVDIRKAVEFRMKLTKSCIVADTSDVTFGRLQAEAWVAPIDWAQFHVVYTGLGAHHGRTTLELLFDVAGPDTKCITSVFVCVAEHLGAQALFDWAEESRPRLNGLVLDASVQAALALRNRPDVIDLD